MPEYYREPVRPVPVDQHRSQRDRLIEIIANNPGVERYINFGAVHTAGSRLVTAGQLDGRLLAELHKAYKANPDRIALLLIPDWEVVIAEAEQRVTVFAPVLGCTLKAIDVVCQKTPANSYEIVHSRNNRDILEAGVWRLAQIDPTRILTYDPGIIAAEDYIALGAMGMLSNEVFRKPLQQK